MTLIYDLNLYILLFTLIKNTITLFLFNFIISSPIYWPVLFIIMTFIVTNFYYLCLGPFFNTNINILI